MGKNPFQGTISFDNIGMAWVAIFLVISLEGWTDIMYYVQDAHSFWDWIYFVLLIVVSVVSNVRCYKIANNGNNDESIRFIFIDWLIFYDKFMSCRHCNAIF